ncbi:MAG TPA: hypothetical protein VE990_05555 [Acidimicrobiales bacterium]|nr:hypothetical protein [Acidimicrobiales bacterium]
MKVAVDDVGLVGIVECLAFLAELCAPQEDALSAVLGEFSQVACSYGAADLRADLLGYADLLARALGFPDADMDPTKPDPRPAATR